MGRTRLPGIETIRDLAPVAHYAKAHWVGIAISIALMAVQATANTGRLVLIYPIMTRVLLPQAGQLEPGSEGAEGVEDATQAVETVQRKAQGLSGALDAMMDWSNSFTGRLVPNAWIEGDNPDAKRDQYATLLSVLLLFGVFILVMCAASYGESYVAEKVRLRILMDVREDVCRRLLDQPVGFYDKLKRGELVQRVLGDVQGYAVAVRLILTGVVRGLLHIIVTLGILIGVSWQLTLVCMLGLPFLIPMRALMRRTLKRAHKRQQQSARRVEVLLQIISGIRMVKAFGSEESRVQEFRATDEEVTARGLKVQRARSAADALTAFINNFLAMLLAVGGGFLILRGILPVQPADLVLFLILVSNLYQPLKRVVKQFTSLQDSMASVQRTTEYLNLPTDSPDLPGAGPFPGLAGPIRFENVSFEYVEGQPVLHNVSFDIPRGATVALVGPSGGGKSTICDLLLRFYDPTTGRVEVNGKDARSFTRKSMLAKTAVVTQSPFLFHTSILENIRQGKPTATQAEIEAATAAAQIHDFIDALPEKYEEEVGESGARLSGGQRQRITIARALVRNPEILVLDEATSSLDTSSEKAVQEALDKLQEGRTTLVVAHRLSTVRNADRIVVLQDGRVVAQGTHDHLVGQGGMYAELVAMQDLGPKKVDS